MELEHMFQVAEKHFFAKQYNDVKLDNIANELWIKKPSLYYYFENKRDFFTKTLKHSMKTYIDALRWTTKQEDLQWFIHRYLDYPSKNNNLFAIASQKGYGDDKEINQIIYSWKQVINREIYDFLRWFNLTPIRVYIVCNLMDKLAMENCIDAYCLDYSITDLTKEIETLITGAQ